MYCGSLKQITIGNGIESICSQMFHSCASLESVEIPDSAVEIGLNAFYQCSSLKSVTIGNGVKRINLNAFAGCSSLQKVKIGNSVERIENSAFSGTAITMINLPESVSYINNRAFYCEKLASVTIENPTCDFSSIGTVFRNEQDSHGNDYYNGVIYGYNGSTAQEYCKAHGCKFISLNDGDMNCDGNVNLVDAVMLARAVTGFEQPDMTVRGKRHAELDGEEGLSNGDLAVLLRILAEA